MITFPFFRSLLFLPKINLHKKKIITSFYRSNIHQENEFQIRLYFLNKNSENIKKIQHVMHTERKCAGCQIKYTINKWAIQLFPVIN